MDKKKLQQIIVILPIILIGGIFAYYKYLLSPLNDKKKALNSEMETIKKEYQESVGRAARLPQLEREIESLNLEISEIHKKLPRDKDVAALIRMLSKKMETFGITWKSLTPGNPITKDYYYEHSYTIPFSTNRYHNLAQFLAEIGQMERIFATRFAGLRPEIDAKTGQVVISGDLIFLVYTSKT